MAKWGLDSTEGNVPCIVENNTPHYDHPARAHRHTLPGHLLPPVRLGLCGRRGQEVFFLPSGARGGSVEALDDGSKIGAHWVSWPA